MYTFDISVTTGFVDWAVFQYDIVGACKVFYFVALFESVVELDSFWNTVQLEIDR